MAVICRHPSPNTTGECCDRLVGSGSTRTESEPSVAHGVKEMKRKTLRIMYQGFASILRSRKNRKMKIGSGSE